MHSNTCLHSFRSFKGAIQTSLRVAFSCRRGLYVCVRRQGEAEAAAAGKEGAAEPHWTPGATVTPSVLNISKSQISKCRAQNPEA